MTPALTAAIVRVRHANGAIVGGGFLVGDRRVLTCAHVVADALGRERSDLQRPEAEVFLDFPLLPGAPTASAHVEVWRPLGPGGSDDPGQGDIAVLELVHPTPTGAQPIRRVGAGNLWRRRFGAFGFPTWHDDGTYSYGHCLGPQASGWIQVESTSEYRIEGGYSGTPAWDDERDLIIGMVVAAEGAHAVKAAWVIPASTLADLCPGLNVVVLAEKESAAPAAGVPRAVFRAPPRNLIFTGREQLLTDLEAALVSGKSTALVQAITGLGGAGKTQVAIEYAHRHRNDYRVIWWLRAETPETLLEDLAALAIPLGLAVPTDAAPAEVAATVRRELEVNPGWLLVFDNADSLDVIRDHLPDRGHMLITSRNPAWRARATVLEVDVWSPQEAVTFLLTRTGRSEAGSAAALAEALGHLPLALEQAGAYMEVNATPFAHYLHLYRRGGAKLLTQHGPRDYGETVATTWRLSFDQVREASPAAAIDAAAYGPDHPVVAIRVNNLARVLHNLGDLAEARRGFERALAIDAAAYGPHHPSVATLVNNLALVLHDLGDLAEARRGFERALAIHEAAYGPDHPSVATAGNNLAGVLRELGDLAGARQGFERALAIDEAAYGPDHPEVATNVANLANVLSDLGDLAGARHGFERALRIITAAWGPDHPRAVTIAQNLQSLD
jgi:tetratricopeptide (TPR) repeat protein